MIAKWLEQLGSRIVRRSKRDKALNPQERRFDIGGQTVVINPLVLDDYMTLFATIGKFADRLQAEGRTADLASLDGIDLTDVGKLDQTVRTMGPIVGEIAGEVAQALWGIDPAHLRKHLTMRQAMDLMIAIIEVNEIPDIRKKVTRAIQMWRASSEA